MKKKWLAAYIAFALLLLPIQNALAAGESEHGHQEQSVPPKTTETVPASKAQNPNYKENPVQNSGQTGDHQMMDSNMMPVTGHDSMDQGHESSGGEHGSENGNEHGVGHEVELPENRGIYKINSLTISQLIVNSNSTASFSVVSSENKSLPDIKVTASFHSQESKGHGATEETETWEAKPNSDGSFKLSFAPPKEGEAILLFTVSGPDGEDYVQFPLNVQQSPPSSLFLIGFGIFVLGTLITSTIMRINKQQK